MTDDASRENEHFQQVLDRLDALMKHGKAVEDTPPEAAAPAPLPFEPHQSQQSAPSSGADIPFLPAADFLHEGPADTEGAIPVLTDIYDGPLPAAEPDDVETRERATDAIINDLLPAITTALDLAIAEESEKMQLALKERLPGEIADALRQLLLRDEQD